MLWMKLLYFLLPEINITFFVCMCVCVCGSGWEGGGGAGRVEGHV